MIGPDAKIFVAGHRGLVGSAILRTLQRKGYSNFLTRSRNDVDLLDRKAVQRLFEQESPSAVVLAAAMVGGIHANSAYPAEFIYDNLQIQNNVIDLAHRSGVKKLVFLGSSCIYPKLAPQPIKEDSLLTGPLEPTNEAYAIAKIAGIKMCQAYSKQYGMNCISLMPTNLYGPNDNFDLSSSHVLPALIRKFVEAVDRKENEVTLWGSGSPRREFLHVDDMAEACVHLLETYNSPEIVNVGVGEDVTIKELAGIIAEEAGFKGSLRYDASKPDGTPRKLLDVAKIRSLGWQPKIDLRSGIRSTIEWYRKNK